MKTDKETIKILLIILLFTLIYFFYQRNLRNNIAKNGVFSKCMVLKKEGRKAGKMMTIEYFFRGEKIKGYLTNDYSNEIELNKEYFIKVAPDNSRDIIFLDDKPVPDCLINEIPPIEGWKEIPKCSN